MSGLNPSSPYHDIGEQLRAAREEHRWSLLEISQAIHIRQGYLQALEEGRWDALPGKAYIKGYLRRYADYLHLDEDEILRQVEQLEASDSERFFLPEGMAGEQKPARAAIWGGMAAACFLYVIWWFSTSPGVSPSIVEAAPSAPKIVPIHAPGLRQVTCARERIVLYPPCHTAGYAVRAWAPAQSQKIKSVKDGAARGPIKR